jgi:hypothetical protein
MCSNFSTARRKAFLMRKLHAVLRFSAPTSSSLRNRTLSSRLVCSFHSLPSSGSHMRVTVSQFHVEPALVGHGSCCPCCHRSLERWRTSARLGGFRWYRLAPLGQLCHWILRGTECRKRGQGSHGFTCTQGQGEALGVLARNRICGLGSRRHDLFQNRRHRPRRLSSHRSDQRFYRSSRFDW